MRQPVIIPFMLNITLISLIIQTYCANLCGLFVKKKKKIIINTDGSWWHTKSYATGHRPSFKTVSPIPIIAHIFYSKKKKIHLLY